MRWIFSVSFNGHTSVIGSDALLAMWALPFIAYNAIGEARQPMTGKKGFHSSKRTDKTPAATEFWAADTTVEVT
jgi:hypothetical protein